MEDHRNSSMDFFSSLTSHQANDADFFDANLLRIVQKELNMDKILITGYDKDALFTRWVDLDEGRVASIQDHKYYSFSHQDPCSSFINLDCAREQVSAHKPSLRLYRSSDIIPKDQYDSSNYAQWLKKDMDSFYSVALPFGSNGCYHLVFYKNQEQGDFNEREMDYLMAIYQTLFQSYAAFKKCEEFKHISDIQNQIINLGQKAYLIADTNMKVLAYNDVAIRMLCTILGYNDCGPDRLEFMLGCIPFLIDVDKTSDEIQVRNVKGYIFSVYKYVKPHEVGLPEVYYYITIQDPANDRQLQNRPLSKMYDLLSPREIEIVQKLNAGKSYKDIAEELFLSYHTVKNHVRNIFEKCDVHSQMQLIAFLDGKDL